MEEFVRAGVEVIFLNREIGKSAEDDLLLQMQGMIAEYEHAKIVERSRRGKRHAARRCERAFRCAVWLSLMDKVLAGLLQRVVGRIPEHELQQLYFVGYVKLLQHGGAVLGHGLLAEP